jgi:hypothetical protein
MTNRSGNKQIITKAVLGILFIAAGILLSTATGTKPLEVKPAQAASQYRAEWKATKLLSIYTGNLRVKYANTSSRKWLAIGPAEWKVEYYNGATKVAEETWTTGNPNCYSATNPCAPGGANAGSYLWGIASESRMDLYRAMTIEKKNVDDPLLYDTSSVNRRFQGPGAVGETNQGDNIEGFYTAGAYGWFAGNVSNCEGCRQRTAAVGTMIPLKWTVQGQLLD